MVNWHTWMLALLGRMGVEDPEGEASDGFLDGFVGVGAHRLGLAGPQHVDDIGPGLAAGVAPHNSEAGAVGRSRPVGDGHWTV